MGSTSFNGPVRSTNGFQVVSKNASTGQIANRSRLDGSDARRVSLSEYFQQKPALNAVLDTTGASSSPALIAYTIANKDFEVLGTNMTTALCVFNTTNAGIMITTAGADEDQAIVTPHLDTAQTIWTGTKWGTENYVQWEATVTTVTITDVKIWAGLKLTNDQLIATDDNQAFFKFQTDATNSEAFTDFTVLHFVYSIAGTDYITALPITVAPTTSYHLKIVIDENRQATIFVNGLQYNISNVAGSTGGTAATMVHQDSDPVLSRVLTNDIDLIPYIGVETGIGTLKSIIVAHEGISRILFE